MGAREKNLRPALEGQAPDLNDPLLRLIGRDGAATPGLYAIGTLAGGHFFESVAVPELAAQAARLARALASPAAA